jgi:general secretion pathway protein G
MRARGFTLIELVITVAIVAVLASVALPLTEVAVQRAKEQDLRRALRDIREAIDAYKQAADEGHVRKKVGDSGYPPRLEVLVEEASEPGKKDLLLRRIPPTRSADSSGRRRDLGQPQLLAPAWAPREGYGRVRRVLPSTASGD